MSLYPPFLYLNTETTHRNPNRAEVLNLAIVDSNGFSLLHTLVKPERAEDWPEAGSIHGILPSDVADKPTLMQLSGDIRRLVYGRHVVMYNAAYHQEVMAGTLTRAMGVHCCKLAYAEFEGKWDHRFKHYRWHKLTQAAVACGHEYPDPMVEPSTAYTDALACRTVWQHMVDREFLTRSVSFVSRPEINQAPHPDAPDGRVGWE